MVRYEFVYIQTTTEHRIQVTQCTIVSIVLC